jgi:hypothetical protein
MDNIVLMTDSLQGLALPPVPAGHHRHVQLPGVARWRLRPHPVLRAPVPAQPLPVEAGDPRRRRRGKGLLHRPRHAVPRGRLAPCRRRARWRLPIRIRAVSEGWWCRRTTCLLTVESLDPELFWLVTWVETFLMRLWYPITVATQSWHVRRTIRESLLKTGGIEGLNFKLHDFGARGVSVGRVGCARRRRPPGRRLEGSDTVEGVVLANNYYGDPWPPSASPPPSTAPSRAGARPRVRGLRQHAEAVRRPGQDRRLRQRQLRHLQGRRLLDQQSEEIKASGATLVIRPDSGDPVDVLLNILYKFEDAGLVTVNAKGFRRAAAALPPHPGRRRQPAVDRGHPQDAGGRGLQRVQPRLRHGRRAAPEGQPRHAEVRVQVQRRLRR